MSNRYQSRFPYLRPNIAESHNSNSLFSTSCVKPLRLVNKPKQEHFFRPPLAGSCGRHRGADRESRLAPEPSILWKDAPRCFVRSRQRFPRPRWRGAAGVLPRFAPNPGVAPGRPGAHPPGAGAAARPERGFPTRRSSRAAEQLGSRRHTRRKVGSGTSRSGKFTCTRLSTAMSSGLPSISANRK